MVDESIYFLNNHRDLPAAGVESFFNHETHERHEKNKNMSQWIIARNAIIRGLVFLYLSFFRAFRAFRG